MQPEALLSTPKQYTTEFLIDDLFNKSRRITDFIKSRGYPIQEMSAGVHKKIHLLPTNQLVKIHRDFNFLEELISEPGIERESEENIVKLVMSRTHLKVDDSFWKRHGSDDVIELYNEEGIQTYRSFNMFRTTGYSLLDLNLYAWDDLWERSSRSLTDLQAVARDILSGKIEDYVNQSPGEAIKEVLDTTLTQPFQPRTLLTRVQQVATCRDVRTNKIRGFAVTSSSKVLSVGKDSESIRFI